MYDSKNHNIKSRMSFIKIIIFFIILFFNISTFADEVDEKFYVAVKAFNDNFYDASISLFERFIESFPKEARVLEAKLYIAKCYYFKKDYSKALNILNEIKSKASLNSSVLEESYFWLADIYFKGKNFKESLFYLDKLKNEFPKSKFIPWVYLLKGDIYVELGDKKNAEENFKIVVNTKETEDVLESAYNKLLDFYFQEDDFTNLLEYSEKYLKNLPKGEIEKKVYYYLGEVYYSQGNIDKAIDNYKIALKENEDVYFCDLIYKGLGFCYLEKKDLDTAKSYIYKIKTPELRVFFEGMYYFKIKDYPKAIDTFNIFLENFKDSKFIPNAYLNRASSLYEVGRIKDSISDYLYILNKFNSTKYQDLLDKAHYGLAWAYLKNGEYKKAIEEFKNTLKYTDNSVVKLSSKIQIADTYQDMGEYDKALEIYNDIIKNNPNTVYTDYLQFQIALIFLKTKKINEAVLALKNIQKNFPNSKLSPQVLYFLAVGYFSMEKYNEAIDLLEDFIEGFSDNNLLPQVYYLYGKCFFNKKDYLKAIDIFNTTLEKFKDDFSLSELLYIDISNTYLNMSDFDMAKKTLETFLKKYPNSQYSPYVTLKIGEILEKQENFLDAEVYYKKVLEYKDSSYFKDALFSLAHIYWRQGDLNLAEEYFKKLINIKDPISLKAKLALAKVYSQKLKIKEAIELYDELINSGLEISKLALLNKGFLLKDLADYKTAIGIFKEVVSKKMDSPQVRFNLAFCFEKLDKLDEAVEEYFNVIYLFDDLDYKVKAYFNIAKIYEKQKKINMAKDIYNKIIGLNVKESEVAKTHLKILNEGEK